MPTTCQANTQAHKVRAALFSRGLVRVGDEQDADRPHSAVPGTLGRAGSQEGAEADRGHFSQGSPPPRVRRIDSAQNTSVHMADCA